MNRLLAILSLLCFLNSYSQDFKADLKLLADSYEKMANLSMKVNVNVQYSKNGRFERLGTAKMQKSGVKYYSKFLDDELICDGDQTVIINHADKTVSFLKYSVSIEDSEKNQVFNMNIESVFEGADTIIYKQLKSAKSYTILSSDNIITSTEIIISSAGLIQTINYTYMESTQEKDIGMHKVNIEYFDVSKNVLNSLYNISSVVVAQGGKYKLVDRFKNYKLEVVEPSY